LLVSGSPTPEAATALPEARIIGRGENKEAKLRQLQHQNVPQIPTDGLPEAVTARPRSRPSEPTSLPLDELAVSFRGRPDLDDLWDRVSSGQPIEDPAEKVLIQLAESRAHERAGRLGEAATSARGAIEAARAIGDPIGVAGGLSHLAYATYRLGRPDEASRIATQALDATGPHAHTVTALLVLGMVATDACRWEEARERFLTARTWSTEIGYPLGIMLALHNLSVVYTHTGRFDLALGAANDVGALNQEIRYPGWAYPWTRAIVSQIVGDRQAARDALDELYAIEPPPVFATALGRMLEAQLALDEEDIDEAERALVAARVEAERLGNPMVRSMVLLVTSRVRRARDDPASARGWVDEAIGEVDRSGLSALEGWMRLELVRVHWALGDLDAAETSVREVLAAALDRDAAHIVAEASIVAAVLATERGSPEADAAWVEAAQRVTTGGYGFLLERERSAALPCIVELARSDSDEVRHAGQAMLELCARTAPVPLRILGLGRFEVAQGRRVIPEAEWRRRRAGELFRLLLLHRGRRALRDAVVEALWPDQDPESAHSLLHQASSALRRVLEPDLPGKFPSRYLRVRDETIGLVLPPGSTVDFERFESLAADYLRNGDRSPQRLTEALDVYAGELFPEDRYSDWATPRRESVARLAARAGVAAAEELLGSGDAIAARDAGILALERDPLDEDAVRISMRASIALGDRIGALRLYRSYERQLADDLGGIPSEELRTLAATVGAEPLDPAG
jgi:DNA-binding SARP family transcriptional activator